MAIVRWSSGPFGTAPFPEFERLRGQMMRQLDTMARSFEGRGLSRTGVYPTLNISQDEQNLYIMAELPGMSAEELELTIENDNLTLRGEKKLPDTDQKVNYHRREREAGFFRRVISLPVRVDADQVTAQTQNGLLTITLPLAAEAKPRQISIVSQ